VNKKIILSSKTWQDEQGNPANHANVQGLNLNVFDKSRVEANLFGYAMTRNIVQTRAMKTYFQIAECSRYYAKRLFEKERLKFKAQRPTFKV